MGDAHCIPSQDNRRAEWLGKLIVDLKPDTVINLGDNADMESLCSYDKGTKNFIGRTYKADIDSHLDFQERMWWPMKKRHMRRPRRVFTLGNHEQRIERAIQVQPELEGSIGYKDLRLEEYYNDVIYYKGSTPGLIEIDGVTYGHYFVTGISGRPTSGSNPSSLALSKSFRSVTQGHAHILDFASRPAIDGSKLYSLVAGCFMEEDLNWAGTMNKLWWRGCFIKRNVSKGQYDLEFISMERLKKAYG